jgi:hypothetical protein
MLSYIKYLQIQTGTSILSQYSIIDSYLLLPRILVKHLFVSTLASTILKYLLQTCMMWKLHWLINWTEGNSYQNKRCYQAHCDGTHKRYMSQIKPDYVVTAIKRQPKNMQENTFMERFKYWQQHFFVSK